MRALVLAITAALLVTSAAAQSSPLAGFSPYWFGMSDAEARAADPSLEVFPYGSGEITLLRSRNATFFGRVPLRPILLFRSDQLTDVTYTNSGTIADADACDDVLRETVNGLEATLGAASGGVGPGELGRRLSGTQTRLGSELRFYTNADGLQRGGFATWRGDGLWGEASSLYTDGIVAANTRVCAIEVAFRAVAPPVYPPLTPPTAAELQNAHPITAPRWEEQADTRTWEATLPGWRLQRNTEVDVELDCLVLAGGALNCVVARENPEDHFFGDMALYLSRSYRIVEHVNGETTEGRRVRLPIHTRLHVQGDAPPPQGGPSEPDVPIEELQALAAQAPGQAELETAALFTGMVWVERPSAQDFSRHYPPAALQQNLGGRAVLDCLINADGTLRCAILSEEPQGLGFGLAALGLSRSFRAAPEVNGESTAGRRTRIPISFRLS